MVMRRWAWIIGLMVAAAGCGRKQERPLGPLTPESVQTGGEYGVVGEETSPAQAPPDARPTAPGAAAGERQATYMARLGEVPLPVGSRIPVFASENVEDTRFVNTILAKVNQEVITREDILGPIRPQVRRWRKELSKDEFEERFRSVVESRLREEISARLVVQEARRRLSEQEKHEIEATLGQILKNLTSEAGSRLLLEERLRLEGKTVEEEIERHRERLLVQRYLRDRIGPGIHVTHSELLAYYEMVRPQRYQSATRMRMRLILVRKSDFADRAAALEHAKMVTRRALSGEDFAKLARQYSHDVMAGQGGDWGYVTKGAFRVRAVDDVLFTLRQGEIGPVIETLDGFYIIKAEDRQEARIVPFTEVQDQLDEEVRDRKYNAMVSRYIQELFDRAYVQVLTENL
jgi:parvulin-like peptidyl-prolyl isomerase